MEMRTRRSTVRFSSEFRLYGFDEPQPPGEYRVEYDEEEIEGATFLAFRRVATFIYLPAVAAGQSTRQMVSIDPADLEAALAKDCEQI